MAASRNERPSRRTNPSGERVWVARWTDRTGKRRVGWPPEIKGTHKLRREAQDAIDACYALEDEDVRPSQAITIGQYNEVWLKRHPRTDRTEESYRQRVGYVLGVLVSDRALRDWPMDDFRRRQANDLVDHLLRVQGRAADGARGVLRVLSAMWEDAINDEYAKHGNPFMGLRIRSSDPRVTKPKRRRYIWTWQQMHDFAVAAALPRVREPGNLPKELRDAVLRRWAVEAQWRAVYPTPMLRTLADVGGLRLGELLPLERGDLKLAGCDEQGCDFEGPHMHIRRTAYKGVVSDGTKTDHGQANPGRVAPIAAPTVAVLQTLPPRIDTRLLFPTPTGRLFSDRNFYRDVWEPARAVTGMPATPHEFRHSYVSLMRAAGVDPADLAAWTGHTVLTATMIYTHSTGASAELARKAIEG